MTQAKQTLSTIKLLSIRMHGIELSPSFPNGEAIINAYEIVIKELAKLLHYYENGTFEK